jgi:hypothetical protein
MNETREIARFVSETQYEDLPLNLIDEFNTNCLYGLKPTEAQQFFQQTIARRCS